MLRKDVKIGFVVGGILIATLIAYVVVAGRGKPKTVELAEGETVQAVQPAGSEEPATVQPEVQPQPAQPEANAPTSTESGGSAPREERRSDPFQPSNGSRDVWATALNSGTVLMSMTPSAPAPTTPSEPAAANTAVSTPVTETVPSLVPGTQPTSISNEPRGEVAQPGRKHVIQKGETLTMVAIAAYGDQKYWKQIAAANPSLNPNRIKVGTTIVLPQINTKKEQVAGPLNGGVSAPVSSKTQYEVQSGDSLRRIALKLYGKESMWQKIYELNKAQIGADPAKLKLHMTLKLPQPPTTA